MEIHFSIHIKDLSRYNYFDIGEFLVSRRVWGFHLDILHHTSGNMNSFLNCVVKERHGRTVSVLLVTVGLHRAFQNVGSPSAKFDHPGRHCYARPTLAYVRHGNCRDYGAPACA